MGAFLVNLIYTNYGAYLTLELTCLYTCSSLGLHG